MKKPDYICTGDLNSFAFFTVTKRLPSIVRSIIENNSFSSEILEKLEELFRDIPGAEFKPLPGTSGVNRRINEKIKTEKYRWNKAPFIFVENYLYHRLKEICGYSANRYDYFAFKKNNDVLSKKDELLKAIEDFDALAKHELSASIKQVMHSYLFGNAVDLSQAKVLDKSAVNLLIDDSEKTGSVLANSKQIDIILDNSGEELLYDILFSYWVLNKTKTATVNLHFKTFPYFVSDALKSDFHFLLKVLSETAGGKNFSAAIYDRIARGSIVLLEDDFWTDTDDFLSTPENIKNIFLNSDLIIFKGDLNYRKLVEDRHWEHNTGIKEIITYPHKNCLALRVLKSELITGLKNVPDASNNEWMYNGKYGIIQLAAKLQLRQ